MEFRQEIRPGCGRLAPSPTGGLHVGHARSFLVAWLASRRNGGPLIMRIEDLDATRARPEATAAALEDLRWLGLTWDEGPDLGGPRGPYVQSGRRAVYDEALARLKAAELVYPCTCTRADIERASSAPHAEDEGPTYPGTCAHRSAADATALGDRPFAWRFRIPPGEVAWVDLVLGPRSLDPARLGGDFLVGRNGQGPSYQLAVVVDDALMGIDRVIRGDDLVPSTPRQSLLYQALGWSPPLFGHLPLVLGPDERRLAKRDGSIKLAALREGGLDPRRLVGVLARSCGLTTEVVNSRPEDWIDAFAFSKLPRAPWTASPDDWLGLGPSVGRGGAGYFP